VSVKKQIVRYEAEYQQMLERGLTPHNAAALVLSALMNQLSREGCSLDEAAASGKKLLSRLSKPGKEVNANAGHC